MATGGVDAISISSARVTATSTLEGAARSPIRVRHDGGAREPDTDIDVGFGTGASRSSRTLDGPAAGHALPLPCRRTERRRNDRRQTRTFATSAGPLAIDRTGAALGRDGRPDRHRRPGRARHELVVRARHDDVVRDLDRGHERRLGRARSRSRRRSPGSLLAPSTTHVSSPRARQGRRAARTWCSGRRAPRRRSPTASGISLDARPIGADVATSGLETRVWVEVGRGGAVVSRTAAVVPPARGSAEHVSLRVTGLPPGTRYAFRVLASTPPARRTGRPRRSARRPVLATSAAGSSTARSSGRTAPTAWSGRRSET